MPNAERTMPNADREPKSPKQAKINRSAIQANQSVPCTQVNLKITLVSLNIAQVSLKKAQVSLLRLALSNGNGFPCFGDFASRSAFGILRSAFAKVTPADFNTVTISANYGSPHLKMYSYGPDRYIKYANFHYTPVYM